MYRGEVKNHRGDFLPVIITAEYPWFSKSEMRAKEGNPDPITYRYLSVFESYLDNLEHSNEILCHFNIQIDDEVIEELVNHRLQYEGNINSVNSLYEEWYKDEWVLENVSDEVLGVDVNSIPLFMLEMIDGQEIKAFMFYDVDCYKGYFDTYFDCSIENVQFKLERIKIKYE